MKYFLIILTTLINVNFVFSQEEKSVNQTLEKVSAKLKNLNSVNYDLTRELNYPSNNYKAISKWNCYYFFDSNKNPNGLKFQINNSSSSDIFNGTEYFSLNKEDKTYELLNKPQKEDIESNSYFYNSILTLRNILPIIIADQTSKKSISDTLIDNKPYKKVRVNIEKRRIQNFGEDFDKMETNYDFIYTILIDSQTNFPKEILQTNNSNSDFIKTSFENVNEKPNIPTENSWFYSTYKNDYHELENQSQNRILPIGSKAPNWKLKILNENKTISLNDLKGKVVLIEFWIKNCSNCIASIPFLNEIQEKFKKDDFVLLGINSYDSTEKIDEFYKKYGLKYQVLTNGDLVAKDYGVYAFPTIIIIDKSGKIIYVENEKSDRSQIESQIKKNLQ